jgi:excisionase family DNA binding protein
VQMKSTGGRPRENAPPGYLTVRQVAERFGVTEQAIRNSIRDGRLPAQMVPRKGRGEGRYYVVPASALVEGATDDEAPISAHGAVLAAKDETIAELRQRVASLEDHLVTLENLLVAAVGRGI